MQLDLCVDTNYANQLCIGLLCAPGSAHKARTNLYRKINIMSAPVKKVNVRKFWPQYLHIEEDNYASYIPHEKSEHLK